MLHIFSARRARAPLGGAFLLAALGTIAGGCQTYSAAPLDLRAYGEELDARAFSAEPVNVFAARLRESDAAVPARMDFADGLTAAEAEVVALFYNPDLRLARLQAGLALATYENAGLWEDPVFGFDGAEILSPQPRSSSDSICSSRSPSPAGSASSATSPAPSTKPNSAELPTPSGVPESRSEGDGPAGPPPPSSSTCTTRLWPSSNASFHSQTSSRPRARSGG